MPPVPVGERMPDFRLRVATKDGLGTFHLAEALGKGPLLLAFYPLAFTSTCTEQVCDARDGMAAFARLGVAVLGVSTDTPYANRAFARQHDLPFRLLSDPNREVVPRIWETQTVVGVEGCAKRGLVLLDADGVVRWSWITDDPDEWPGYDEVRRRVAGSA